MPPALANDEAAKFAGESGADAYGAPCVLNAGFLGRQRSELRTKSPVKGQVSSPLADVCQTVSRGRTCETLAAKQAIVDADLTQFAAGPNRVKELYG